MIKEVVIFLPWWLTILWYWWNSINGIEKVIPCGRCKELLFSLPSPLWQCMKGFTGMFLGLKFLYLNNVSLNICAFIIFLEIVLLYDLIQSIIICRYEGEMIYGKPSSRCYGLSLFWLVKNRFVRLVASQ